jgi:hypothetical protein
MDKNFPYDVDGQECPSYTVGHCILHSSRMEGAVSQVQSLAVVNIMNNSRIRDTSEIGAEVPATPKFAEKPGRGWRLPGLMLLLLIGATAGSYIVFRFVLPSVPRELVGTWQVTKGDLKGATLEFRWYGTGIATMPKDGKNQSLESSVRVRGKRIFMTSKSPITRLDETVIQTIVQITDEELVIRDQDDVTYHLIRID